jgi:catalase
VEFLQKSLCEGKKVKVNFTLEQAMKAQRGSRGIALLFFNLGARWGWVVNATPRPFYPEE